MGTTSSGSRTALGCHAWFSCRRRSLDSLAEWQALLKKWEQWFLRCFVCKKLSMHEEKVHQRVWKSSTLRLIYQRSLLPTQRQWRSCDAHIAKTISACLICLARIWAGIPLDTCTP